MEKRNKQFRNNKHPRGLTILTFAEFWDRFSFCGTLTVLILHLTTIFLFSETKAYATWGTFLALGYITPVLGGILADRVLGFERAIIIGSILMIFGNLLLSFQSSILLYLGLSLLLCGIGLFKGNISSLVGMLYTSQDQNRHKGYSRFFMGIMLGAILGPLLFGLLSFYFSWRSCFLVSAFGNLLSLIVFIAYRNYFHYQNAPPKITLVNKKLFFSFTVNQSFYLSLAFTVVLISALFVHPILSNNFLGFISFSIVLFLTLFAIKLSPTDGKKITGLTLLSLLLVFYYAASFQVNGSLIVGISREFKIDLFGSRIPSTAFASLEALFAFSASPLLSKIWSAIEKRFFEPSLLFKINTGLIFAGLSFLIFASLFLNKSHPLSNLILANLLLGISVACIFPTHISAVSKYTPMHLQGTLMGVSFLSDALAGYVGSLMSNISLDYSYVYFGVSLIMFGSAILILLITPFLNFLFSDSVKSALAS